MSLERPSARLELPTAVTKRISSVAYAVDEIGSDEKVDSAVTFGSRWCSCSLVARGRPRRRRFRTEYSTIPVYRVPRSAAAGLSASLAGRARLEPVAHARFGDEVPRL